MHEFGTSHTFIHWIYKFQLIARVPSRVWGRHAPTRSLRKCRRIEEVKSRWNKTFSRIENLWPRDGSCPLPLRSKHVFESCFRIVKTQKQVKGHCSYMIIAVHAERSSCPWFAAAWAGKPVSRSDGSWNFQGTFPTKEKYHPRSAAMILSGWIGGKMNRVCCGAVNLRRK